MQQNYFYPQQPIRYPQQTISFPQQPTLKGRPVSSLEEVRAAAVDFDGSVSIFPDLANRKIYTKQCNMDGTAQLNMYELKELPNEQDMQTAFITRTEFNQAMVAIKDALSKKTKIESDPQTSPTEAPPPTEFTF